jgi:hypothetical protein
MTATRVPGGYWYSTGRPRLLGPMARVASFPDALGATPYYTLALAGFALSIWGFFEIGCLPGTGGSNIYGPRPALAGQTSPRVNPPLRRSPS